MDLHEGNEPYANQPASNSSKPAVGDRPMPKKRAHLHIAFTAMGTLVSLVSLSVKAPPLTAMGELVSDDCCASINT